MTQSKQNDNYTITLDSGEMLDYSDIIDTTGDITINLDSTYGATTTYLSDSTYTLSGNTDTISVSDGTFTLDTNSVDWLNTIKINDTSISPEEIERMCEHYPGLEKVWRNFKSVYDMCKQDFEGKKKAGEIDDDIPF